MIDTNCGGRCAMRDGARVAEATRLIDLSACPHGSRSMLCKERPRPVVQLIFAHADGMCFPAVLTNAGPGNVPGRVIGLELRHRRRARAEGRIREAKATGPRNLPCRGFAENAVWLEAVLTAVHLVCWTFLICFP